NDNFWHWIEEDIENFVSAYNGLRKIAKNTGHSALLTNFTARMDSHARLNRALILKLGVKINRQRELVFGGTVPANLRNQDMRSSLEPIADFFKSSYKSATGLLKHPLAEHMNFRSLDFYYNYRFGPAGENTLIQMERGVLVDVAV
ncbi:MAG: hypothetical protein FWB71_06840, partial [Defluviitaleaceae bacterium]|nr:hypothetical protein [Defluviitaleaceae bacterium]